MRDFTRTDKAMTQMGMTEDEKLAIYTIVAGVLHLGNIEFEEDEGAKGKILVGALPYWHTNSQIQCNAWHASFSTYLGHI